MDWLLIAETNALLDLLKLIWTITKVALGLGFVIFVHELGHFLAAKFCGVKCEKFYVGFDVPIKIGPLRLPRTFGKVQWGETEYGIGVIPLGGYVKMLGQDDNPANAQREAERIRVRPGDEQTGQAAVSQAPPAGTLDASAEQEPFQLDPRSYPAKSVPQRMLIISAGVIMNLVFAVILAAIAYSAGVSYKTCEIAGTSPGDPAWVLGLQPGDKIIQIGRQGQPDEHLRFDWELRQMVAKSGLSGDEVQPMDILIRRADGSSKWIQITPTDRLLEITRFVSLGVRPPRSNRLSQTMPVRAHLAAGKARPQLQGGDRIVGLDGIEFDRSQANESGDLLANQLEQSLAARIAQPVTLIVERQSKRSETPELLDITVPPQQMQDLGLVMKIGPIVALREGSPARQAGFQVGDVLKTFNGQPVGDPMTLPQRIDHVSGPMTWEVERKEKQQTKTIQLTVTPHGPPAYTPHLGQGSRMALEQLGIAYSVRHVVDAVIPGSPAAKEAFQAGDVITRAQFVAEGEKLHKQASELFGKDYNDLIELDDDLSNWPYVHGFMQELLPGMNVKLNFLQDGKKREATLTPVDSKDAYYADRGFNLVPFKRIHTAESVADALALGWRETTEKVTEVANVLWYLINGRVSAKNLGGPIMIAAVAGSEASQGIPRLLLFLTFLSANLAILNFLPIPALDGGHMVFLVTEAIIGRPVDERVQTALTMIGVACLLGLMIFVFANDIGRIFL